MPFQQKYFFSKEDLYELYANQKKSQRMMAAELKIPKSTIGQHLAKLGIKRRTKSEAMQERMKRNPNWGDKFFKKDKKTKLIISEAIKEYYKNKRNEKIKAVENSFGSNIVSLLNKLYFDEDKSLDRISKILCLSREMITQIMKENNIKRKPKYWYINSLKGEKHPLYGKTWEEMYGKERAKKRKEASSERLRELIIERMKKGNFPFFRTKIERMIFDEMNKRNFFFTFQYRIHNFVCDFVLPNQKIVVECDGDYWHANPKIYDRNNLGKLSKIQRDKILRDQIKDEYLRKNEWIVVRFFETDIKKMLFIV